MSNEGFEDCMSELRKINEKLGQISTTNLPSQGFIIFWLGIVPIFSILIAFIVLTADS